jgi:hypothetical protein
VAEPGALPWTEFSGVSLFSPRDGGLYRVEPTGPVRVEIGLRGPQERIYALAPDGADRLYLGTDAGLLRVSRTSCGWAIDTIVSDPVVAIEAVPDGPGLEVHTANGRVHRVGTGAAADVAQSSDVEESDTIS